MESSSESSSASEAEVSGEEETQTAIREDLKSMTFEEIMQLKEELGAKVYQEAVLGCKNTKMKPPKTDLKRLNKNRPREMSSKRQVPFLGAELRTQRKKDMGNQIRDPRFDEKSGSYHAETFKQNYEFVTKIRKKEVAQMQKKLAKEQNAEEKKVIKKTMQQLINKNVEDKKWQLKQRELKKERDEIQKAHNEGRQPHYVTKKERRAKELVAQFEHLKNTGKLTKHLEKRRKKNAAKDRKRISIE